MGEPHVSPGSLAAPRLVVAPDAGALMRLAAEEIVKRARDAVKARGRFTLALSGGSTPRKLHLLLSDPQEPFFGRVPWGEVHVFWGDERHVHPDDPESNYGMARTTLLSRVPIPPEQIHRVRAEETDASVAAKDYEVELRRALGGEGVPRLDLALMGMGADGHTASLFPGNPALEERERLVVAPWAEKLETFRITVTFPVLEAARVVLFLVTGGEKAARVAEAVSGDPSAPGALPATRARPRDGELLWFLDAPAASRIETSPSR